MADRTVGRNWPLVALGAVSAAATVLLAYSGSTATAVAMSGVIGFCASATLILVLALPPLLAPSSEVHSFSAGVFLIGYTISFFTPIISGTLWDATHVPAAAFIPIGAAGLGLLLIGATMRVAPDAHGG